MSEDRPRSRPGLLLFLGSLYFCQGMPSGFLGDALKFELRESGWSYTWISATALLSLPWMFKFAWAPLVDRLWSRRMGRRRSWLIPLQLLLALTLVAGAAFSVQSHLTPLLATVMIVALLVSTQDIAVDGLAVDRLRPEDRGLGNGIQYSAYRLGMILGGGILLGYSSPSELGWSGVMIVQALIVLGLTLVVLSWKEPPAPGDAAAGSQEHAPLELRGAFVDFVKHPGAFSLLFFLLAYKIGDSLSAGIVTPFLYDSGLSRWDVATIKAWIGSGGSIVGALLGGWLAQRIGRLRALLSLGGLHAVSAALYAVAALVAIDPSLLAAHHEALSEGGEPLLTAANNPRWPWLLAASLGEHVSGGAATAALFTLMMDMANPRDGGTHYTVQACVVVCSQLLGHSLAGPSTDLLGSPAAHFAFSAFLCAAALPLVPRLRANPLFRARLPERYW